MLAYESGRRQRDFQRLLPHHNNGQYKLLQDVIFAARSPSLGSITILVVYFAFRELTPPSINVNQTNDANGFLQRNGGFHTTPHEFVHPGCSNFENVKIEDLWSVAEHSRGAVIKSTYLPGNDLD
jgi:hypothetical protein